MKKFLSLLLVAAMLLSLAPTFVIAAEAADTDVKLFDAHITGNVVIGGTLTANFEPADADAAKECGYSLEETIKTIKWSARSRYGSTRDHVISKALATGTKTYIIPDNWNENTDNGSAIIPKPSNHYGIFFTVTPMNSEGEQIGDTVYYSSITARPESVNSAADNKPTAFNAYISPLSGDGLINIGKTVRANYSFKYLEDANIGESGTKYTWYTSNVLLSNSELAEKASLVGSGRDYTITPNDAGKWIYVKIVPVSSDNVEGSAVYARNHLGNAFLNSKAMMVGTTTDYFYASSTSSLGGYPYIKMLTDGCSNTGSGNDVSTFLLAKNTAQYSNKTLVIDAGEQVFFDRFYLNYGETMTDLVISYSTDNINWIELNEDLKIDSSAEKAANHWEYECSHVMRGRYFKLSLSNAVQSKYLRIYEFYPFLKNDAWFEGYFNSKIASFNDNVITVKSLNVPLSDLHKKENGFTLKSDYDAAGSSVNADIIVDSGISYVTKSVTSDGDVYTAIENPENVYVTEDTENTYMKVTGINGVSQYFEINVDAKVTTSINYTNAVFANLTNNVIKVKAWGTPLAELHKKANGFVLTSDDDEEGSSENADEIIENGISYVTKSVTSDGDVYIAIENPENVYVTEETENTYMKITGTNGVSQYVEVKYAGHIAESSTEEAITGNANNEEDSTGNHPLNMMQLSSNNTDGDGYLVGKYLFKTQLYVPSQHRVTFQMKQGGLAQNKNNISGIMFLMGHSTSHKIDGFMTVHQGDIVCPNAKVDTGYNFKVNNWYDFEVLFDYDKLDRVNKKISISAWVDGEQLYDELLINWVEPAHKLRVAPFFHVYASTIDGDVKHKNSSFRQVWSADTHVVENDYDLMIVNSDAADVEATTLAAGNYTATTNMKVYKGSGLVTYIAKYYVNGDVKELMDVANVASDNKYFVTITEEELAANEIELKAITMSTVNSAHYPQFVSKSLKMNK